jgi:hypothetical protein
VSEEVGGHCPVCLAEYRPGFDACADDGTALLPGPAPSSPDRIDEPEPSGPAPRWTPVAEFRDPDVARLLCGRLQSEGIEARIFPEEFATFYGRLTGAMMGRMVQILVPEEQVKEARHLIRQIERENL